MEWTGARKKRTRSTGSTGGVSIGAAHSTATTTTTATTSIGPLQFIGQGGDQPPEKNVSLTPTCGAGPLPNIGKIGEKEDDKDKGKEQEKSMAKPSSPIQVINLDSDTNPMDGQDQDASQQGDTLALSVANVATSRATSQSKPTPLISRKLFDPTTLQSTINVLSTESWLEETIDRKKRRYEDVAPSKDLITQVTSSQPSKKTKK